MHGLLVKKMKVVQRLGLRVKVSCGMRHPAISTARPRDTITILTPACTTIPPRNSTITTTRSPTSLSNTRRLRERVLHPLTPTPQPPQALPHLPSPHKKTPTPRKLLRSCSEAKMAGRRRQGQTSKATRVSSAASLRATRPRTRSPTKRPPTPLHKTISRKRLSVVRYANATSTRMSC
eukprot:Rmarinus@m.20369